MYSIPVPAKQGLVTFECVCRTVPNTNNEEGTTMDNIMKRVVRNVRIWLNKYHILLVCILSVAHIGLSCIHTRDSGRADLVPPMITMEMEE